MVKLLLVSAVLLSVVLCTTPACDCLEEDVDTPYVDTLDATDIMSVSTTLNGNLRSLGKYSSVEVYFRWWSTSDSGHNETPRQTMTSTGKFSVQIIPMMPGTTYKFYAVVEVEDYSGGSDEKTFYVP